MGLIPGVGRSRKYNYLHLALAVGTMPSACQGIPLQDVAHLPNTFSLINTHFWQSHLVWGSLEDNSAQGVCD